MNAETRAKEIVDAENQFCEENSLFVRGDTLDRLQAAITQALRQAENDKLEEAAKIADPPLLHRKGSLGLWRIRRIEIAERIRALKSKDTP